MYISSCAYVCPKHFSPETEVSKFHDIFTFFSGNRVQGANYRNSLNEGFDGTGPGIGIRYAQLRNCIDVSPFIA